MKWFVLTVSFFFLIQTFLLGEEPAKDVNFYLQAGNEQMEKKEYKEAANSFEKANELVPGHPYLIFLVANAYALSGNDKDAARWLNQLLDFGFYGVLRANNPFQKLLSSPEYSALAEKVKKLNQPMGKMEVAFTIPEKNLIAEGLAYDSKDSEFFAGSTYLRKIISIEMDGKYRNFTTSPNGLWQVLGMKVDTARNVLWAATANFGPEMINYKEDEMGKTAIIQFDLKTGQEKKRYSLDNKPVPHGFNDLDLSGKGDVFITDSNEGSVYAIYRDQDQLSQFLPAGTFRFPNGIAVSGDNQFIFVAHSRGISKVNLTDKKVVLLTGPANVTASGIDGLYLYKNTLIGVQNSYLPERIVQFNLDASFSKIEKATILAANHPAFNAPTTGAIANDYFYFIANSQLDSFDENRKILPPDKLKDLVILRVKL
jgi:sugar lactone lactonase YvrE